MAGSTNGQTIGLIPSSKTLICAIASTLHGCAIISRKRLLRTSLLPNGSPPLARSVRHPQIVVLSRPSRVCCPTMPSATTPAAASRRRNQSPSILSGIPQIPLKTECILAYFRPYCNTGARCQSLPRSAIVVVDGFKHLLLCTGRARCVCARCGRQTAIRAGFFSNSRGTGSLNKTLADGHKYLAASRDHARCLNRKVAGEDGKTRGSLKAPAFKSQRQRHQAEIRQPVRLPREPRRRHQARPT